MTILAYILSGLSLLMGILLLTKFKSPLGVFIWAPKLIAGALSQILALIGAAGAVLGWAYQAYWAIPMGILGAGIMIVYAWRCSRDHTGFEDAFGSGWEDQISSQQAKLMVKRRWSLYLKMKVSPEPIWERDIPFWTVPGTDRELLCDIWRPATGNVSGLALVYYHNSGWHLFDKDFYTRPFFHHLAAQGHTIMDVAYRLYPEVGIHEMIGDAKRAIAWMKANADRYGVNPDKIVLAGASAGGHLALLAGYAPGHPELTPEDVEDTDLSVCSIISYYGPSDLLAMYQHTNQHIYIDAPPVLANENPNAPKRMGDGGRLDMLLGGHPQDIPDMYKLASPPSHVHSGCPPTLLIHGSHDVLVPADATSEFYSKLVASGVPAIKRIFPWTDHGFDLPFPQVNPAAQSALYDVDRFLALLANEV